MTTSRRWDVDLPAAPAPRLCAALEQYLVLRTDLLLDEVRRVLDDLCAEAHRTGLGPEKMVVALKRAWWELPSVQRDAQRGDPAVGLLFARVLTACLDAYFG